MKKIYITLYFILFSCALCKAQWVTIPDTAFVSYLQTTFPSCMNGNQLDTTCPGIVNAKSVYCSEGNVADITGIQYFQNLDTLNCDGNQLTTLPSLPASLTYLDCSANNLTALPSLPASLTYLDCSTNNLTALLNLPDSLNYFYCNNNQLTSLPTLPTYLHDFDCSYNNLNALITLPVYLYDFNCSYNSLTALPTLPAYLYNLFCENNPFINNLPSLPIFLSWLTCSNDQLTTLPILSNSLEYLDCSNNQLTTLPALPNSLMSLGCSNNQLTTLPALPSNLQDLYCSNNQLTTLPALPTYFAQLYCSDNQLTILPTLSFSLLQLQCNHNQLTALPWLPASISYLSCDSNQLTVLPALSASLTQLSCQANQLSILPDLPFAMSELNVNNNPSLTCLPLLKEITGGNGAFDISGTGITCLPNVIEHTGSIPAIDTMPICGIFNPSGCEVAWNIKGQVVKDGDGSCATTNDGTPVQNISMKLYNSSNALLQQVYENVNGDYSFQTGLGTYNTVVDTTGLPFTVLCPSTDVHTDTLTTVDSLDYNANFRLYCKPNFDLGVNAICSKNSFFPNRSVTINMAAGDEASYYGVPCNTAGLSGTVTTTISGPVTITSTSSNANAVSTVSGNTITWNVTDFSQVNFNNTFSFVLHTNTSASIGQQVCINTTINAVGTDNNPSNNSLSQCFTLLNSYDPNDKEVNPAGAIAPGYDGYLTYTIHFQNTGTAPAQNIQVLDTISPNLDISTFQLVAFSNQNITQVFDGSRVVKFSFPNINLPDSTANEPASHGYIQYKIKPLSNLPAGDSITNTAYIYFDFNSPIVTNTTSNVLEVTTGIKNIPSPATFAIYPNPVSEQLSVSSNQSTVSSEQLTITDLLGRTILTQTIPAGTKQTTVDVSSLTPSVYFITIHAMNGNVVRKFVKE